jgi:hypothetical protein
MQPLQGRAANNWLTQGGRVRDPGLCYVAPFGAKIPGFLAAPAKFGSLPKQKSATSKLARRAQWTDLARSDLARRDPRRACARLRWRVVRHARTPLNRAGMTTSFRTLVCEAALLPLLAPE